MRVLNFGSLNIDYIYKLDTFVMPGETRAAYDMRVCAGGKGLNQSVALARAGMEVWHAGLIGHDGQFLLETLEKSGVHTEFVQTVDLPTGHTIIQIDQEGENCILLYHGANYALMESYVDHVLSHFDAGDVVLLQNETNLIEKIISKALAKKMRVAFNAAPADKAAGALPIGATAWLFVNEGESLYLSGKTDPEHAFEYLCSTYPNTAVVLTRGKKGSVCGIGSQVAFEQACQVPTIDTTGAGDTFVGYFLRGTLEKIEGIPPLRLAAAASALSVTKYGAANSIPTIADVLKSGLL